MLGLCVGVIFLVANGFAARSVLKVLRGSDSKIDGLKNTLADYEMWVEEAPKVEARERWLAANMPGMRDSTLGKLQGDLIQSLQDEVFNRKLRIDRQSLQEIVKGNFYTEVAVRIEVEGAESAVIDWLTTLQAPDKFQIIKELELELDNRSREIEPQAECEITIARWYHPETGEAIPPSAPDEAAPEEADPSDPAVPTPAPAAPAAPDRVESGS